MERSLVALILAVLLPAIAPAKDSHLAPSHPKPAHVANSHKPAKHQTADHNFRGVRSASAKRNFQASTPCPATGKTGGSCKGYVVDHKVPLACGGADSQENMQWQTQAAAKLKDKTERAGCGAPRS